MRDRFAWLLPMVDTKICADHREELREAGIPHEVLAARVGRPSARTNYCAEASTIRLGELTSIFTCRGFASAFFASEIDSTPAS